MQAKETKLQDMIEGTKQYVVPLFQRTYSWSETHWETLWKDICDIYESDSRKSHFIGSIVSMQTTSVPQGVSKFLLIDGQQRLTTIFIILTLLRDKANSNNNTVFAEEIANTLLVNPYKKDYDYFKLLPTQHDRDNYKDLINGTLSTSNNRISRAYRYFDNKLKQTDFDIEKLKSIISSDLSVVSITLDADDNPYLVFESLNAKGSPLTQADLIRNYLFMRIHVNDQNAIFDKYWHPMQTALDDKLTEFIRHYLMDKGSVIRQSDVYFTIKEAVSADNVIDYMKQMHIYSQYYSRLLNPDEEPESSIRKYLKRLNIIEVTTAYPFLLRMYNYYGCGTISRSDFVQILSTTENYLIRRLICHVPTNQLSRIFASLYPQIKGIAGPNIPKEYESLLVMKQYPRDSEFRAKFKEYRFYAAGERAARAKLVLESIENSFGHKEHIDYNNVSIEHIMPQVLTSEWRKDLGDEAQDIHSLLLHTIGNLTLTAYNSNLSNSEYPSKKKVYLQSHLEINKYFDGVDVWNKESIEKRADVLAGIAMRIWPYFGVEFSEQSVTNTKPKSVRILGQIFDVDSWRDVLECTMNTVAELEPAKFNRIISSYPRYFSKHQDKLRCVRKLRNNLFLEVNLSANDIQRLCHQAIQSIELTSDEWSVDYE